MISRVPLPTLLPTGVVVSFYPTRGDSRESTLLRLQRLLLCTRDRLPISRSN